MLIAFHEPCKMPNETQSLRSAPTVAQLCAEYESPLRCSHPVSDVCIEWAQGVAANNEQTKIMSALAHTFVWKTLK